MTGYRQLARNRDFRVLWVGETVSELGTRMSLFVFPLLAFHLTGSALLAALAEGVHLFGLAAALLPAGLLADRVDRRRLMRTASAGGVLLYASLVVAALTGTLTMPHLLAVALLSGSVAGLFAPAEMSAIRSVVTSEELPTALSQNQARQHVASLVGGPLGGALYSLARWLPFVVDAVTYAVSWFMLGRIRADLSAPEHLGPRQSGPEQLREGLSFIWRSPFLRVLLVWSALANLMGNALFFAAVLRLIQAGFPPVQIGLVETAAGTFGILGALAAPAIIDRFATGRLTVVIAWSLTPLVVPMMFFNNPAVVAAALGLGLFLNPAGNAGIQSYRVAVTPDGLQGRIQSTSQFVSMSVMPLAPVLAGALLAGIGGERAVAVLGVLTMAVALIPTASAAVRAVPKPSVWRETVPAAEPIPDRPRA
ncbi:MAG: major facilitator superfamily 1 [Marmoricola sp.]|nr:major facilitator superfamily 1 [Marmoricola sp.]